MQKLYTCVTIVTYYRVERISPLYIAEFTQHQWNSLLFETNMSAYDLIFGSRFNEVCEVTVWTVACSISACTCAFVHTNLNKRG